jgi:hypothetical protein
MNSLDNISVNESLVSVLHSRKVAHANVLFHTDDTDIVRDLNGTFALLTRLLRSAEFRDDRNTQSVFEICLARLMAAMRCTLTYARPNTRTGERTLSTSMLGS